MEFINLSSTASTLLITLYSRANMSKKNLIIKDEKAEEIIQLAGYSQKKLKLRTSAQIFLTIRAKLIDDYTAQFIDKHHGNCTVIQVACGLDSRYFRLNNPNVKWYDLDLYGTISLRKNFYKQTVNYKMIESNVCNFTWIDKIDSDDLKKPTLIIAEGLFMYLSKEDNIHVFSSLPNYFSDVDIIFDAFSPLVVSLSKHIHTLKRTNASFKFGFKDPKVIEEMSPKIKYKTTMSYNKNKYVKELPFIQRIKLHLNKIFIDKSRRLEVFHIN
jgi:O-methyltransferase involved in polyketide biosynthesis